MKTAAKILTVVNFASSGILWLLGLLTYLFNVLRLWELWHLVGFGFVFYMPVTILPLVLSVVFSCVAGKKRLVILNLLAFAVSICFILLTYLVSAAW